MRYGGVAMTRRTTERALAAVRAAAENVLCERGVSGFSADEVAARSGVAKTTIYRHWHNVHELLLDTLDARVTPVPTPNTGEVATDLIELFSDLLDQMRGSNLRQLMLDVLAASGRDTDLRLAHEAMMESRTEPLRTVLELGVLRGELPADLDLELANDFVQGVVFYRWIVRDRDLDEQALEKVVRAAVRGLHSL